MPVTPVLTKITQVKLRSVLPMKFTLKDATAKSMTNAVASLCISKQISPGVWDTEIVATSASTPKNSNLFRYDAKEKQYVFNLDTLPLSTGTWQLRIQLDDGNIHTVDIQIVK